jgi:3' terminal RNA ribose 2'-O-methyltransferase Hen1
VLLTLTYTRAPATDLGYLLFKNPSRVHERQLAFGTAYVFYPEATDERCTAALLLDIDPVGLVRRGPGGARSIDPYVNDRPYVASSFLSVAIADAFSTAMSGRSKERQELAEELLPLSAHLPVVPSRGGEGLVRRLFEPLGYAVFAQALALDPVFPEWGESRYLSLTIEGKVRLRDLLAHLYVLLPVLDDEKHYWVSEPEIEKLMRRGEGWLAAHPERELMVDRYLVRQRPLTRVALTQLAEDDPDLDASEELHDQQEAAVEAPMSLNEQRLGSVVAALKASGAKSVLDLGCGEGRLLQRLLDDAAFDRIVGIDVSHRSLEIASRRLRLDRLPERKRARIELLHGSLIYRDRRLTGFDAAAVVEVIEHLEPERLAAFEAHVFGTAQPGTVLVTTPNVEYNARFETLPAGRFRHRDHRFEWTRDQFRAWAGAVAERHGYSVRYVPIGPEDPEAGAPTQMAVFTR